MTKQQWTSKPIHKFLHLQSKPVTSSLYLSQARHRVRQQTEKTEATGRKGINRAVSNNSAGNRAPPTPDCGWTALPHPLLYSNRARYIWIRLRTIPEIQCLLLLKWRMSGSSTTQQAVAISQVRITLFTEEHCFSSFVNGESLYAAGGETQRTAALFPPKSVPFFSFIVHIYEWFLDVVAYP